MIDLRDYQADAVEALRALTDTGCQRILLVAPCGSGKTVLSSAIIHSARRNFDGRVLFVVDRIELINQTVAQLARWGVTEVGVIRAEDPRTDPLMPVQVATIQTLNRRALPKADILFCDEAHLALSDSWRTLIGSYPEAVVIGMTATPCRADRQGLGDIFEALHVVAPYSRLIDDGHIVAPRCFGVKSSPDLSNVKTVAGDWDTRGLEDAMSSSEVLGDTLEQYKARSAGRRTVIFACTVLHSLAIAAKFEAAGIRIAHVDANTPEVERAQIGERLRAGELDVVTNVGVYTTGWDEPCVKCLILARPTKSLSLYLQMAGRVLRPWNLISPVLIDQGGNLDRFGFPHEDRPWKLRGTIELPQKKPSKCIKCGAYIPCYPCSECGYAPEVSPREVKIRPEVEIVERTFDAPKDPKRALFDKSLKQAMARGFKPGFAAAKYKEEFGDWPPWSWSESARDVFAKDPDWQQRVEERAKDRERWAPKPMPAQQEEPAPEEEVDYSQGDIPF
jgi:DNA repair protein RadD